MPVFLPRINENTHFKKCDKNPNSQYQIIFNPKSYTNFIKHDGWVVLSSLITPKELSLTEANDLMQEIKSSASFEGKQIRFPSWQEALIMQRVGALNLGYPIRLADYKGKLCGKFNKEGTSFEFIPEPKTKTGTITETITGISFLTLF